MSEQDLRDRITMLRAELALAEESLDNPPVTVTPAMLLVLAKAIDYIYDHTDLEQWGTPCDDLRELIKELEPEEEDEPFDEVEFVAAGAARAAREEARYPKLCVGDSVRIRGQGYFALGTVTAFGQGGGADRGVDQITVLFKNSMVKDVDRRLVTPFEELGE